MKLFIVEKDDLREKNRFFMSFLSLTILSDIKHGNSSKLFKAALSKSNGHRDKGIISAAGGHSIKLVLPTLKSLFKFL